MSASDRFGDDRIEREARNRAIEREFEPVPPADIVAALQCLAVRELVRAARQLEQRIDGDNWPYAGPIRAALAPFAAMEVR